MAMAAATAARPLNYRRFGSWSSASLQRQLHCSGADVSPIHKTSTSHPPRQRHVAGKHAVNATPHKPPAPPHYWRSAAQAIAHVNLLTTQPSTLNTPYFVCAPTSLPRLPRCLCASDDAPPSALTAIPLNLRVQVHCLHKLPSLPPRHAALWCSHTLPLCLSFR